MADLRTNYKDDILSTAEQGTRKFNIVDDNGNVLYEGVHFEDVSKYLQVGDEYGADEINEQNEAINNHTDIIGDTDISNIGDGTISGGLSDLNSKKVKYKTLLHIDANTYSNYGTAFDNVYPVYAGLSNIKRAYCKIKLGSIVYSSVTVSGRFTYTQFASTSVIGRTIDLRSSGSTIISDSVSGGNIESTDLTNNEQSNYIELIGLE